MAVESLATSATRYPLHASWKLTPRSSNSEYLAAGRSFGPIATEAALAVE